MTPTAKRQPTAAERAEAIEWLRGRLNAYATGLSATLATMRHLGAWTRMQLARATRAGELPADVTWPELGLHATDGGYLLLAWADEEEADVQVSRPARRPRGAST